jgi:hypothetical protein
MALGQYAATRWDANQDHPLSTFIVRLHEPGALRAATLRALGDLAAAHPTVGLDGVAEAVASAFEVPNERMIAAAVGVIADVPSVAAPLPIEAALVHPDAQVRRAALRAYLARADALPQDSILQALTHDPDVGVRVALLKHVVSDPTRTRCSQPSGRIPTRTYAHLQSSLTDDRDSGSGGVGGGPARMRMVRHAAGVSRGSSSP